MATAEELELTARAGRPASEFPDRLFPTVYADGVASLTPGPGVVRFVLYRIDPNVFGRGGAVSNPIGQVAMSFYGFAQSAIFFRRQLEAMIEQKVITRETVDQIEADFDRAAAAAAAATKEAGEPRK